MTPREAILRAASRLEAAGVPDPLYDAAALLAHVTSQNALSLRVDSDHELTKAQSASYEVLLRRRETRIPLQHLLGSAWFYGREFTVSGDVLIPRPETELLVFRALALLPSLPAPLSVLDLCTGSGCIAISLRLEADCPVCVSAADISGAALQIARDNAHYLKAQDIRFLQGDLFAPFREEERFSMILSNPPYIPSDDCRELQPEVRHDPMLALDGGKDGLAIIRRILCGAPEHLLPGGALLMEIGSDQAGAVSRLIADTGVFSAAAVLRDEAGLDRIVEARYMPRSDA